MSARLRHVGRSRTARVRPPNRTALARAVRAACARPRNPGSAADPRPARVLAVLLALATVAGVACCWLAPETGPILVALAGLVLVSVRTGLAFAGRCPTDAGTEEPQLGPRFSIVVALHREDDVLAGLLAAIDRLDWPDSLRETVLVVEEDDTITREALSRLAPQHGFRLLLVPDVAGPRTKPRALETARPFLTGQIVTVYDAEDRPDPAQLQAAAAAFATGGPGLGAVQAPLIACPVRDSWIQQQFALDYAVWFRAVLPGLARLSGCLPLGGTSNHVRRDVLEAVGGWDPWNLTEDADLGVRLARAGWRTGLIAPPTCEECPPRLSAWTGQRARWVQGHLQTLAGHLGSLTGCWRDLGWRGMAGLCLGLLVGPLAAVVRVATLPGLLLAVARGDGWVLGLWIAAHALEAVAAAVALRRDGRWWLAWQVLGWPVYHSCQMLAAIRALGAVFCQPHHWCKTEHGARALPAPEAAPRRRLFTARLP